ncbi:MAG: 30S ribosome-binding factor RbfA [Chloroflexi bacterium]|nr:30S ribosome-binding factor RbfA [Chloroflexota bacterium]
MANRRQRRVSDLIHHEVSDLLSRKMKDPRLEHVTVTGVEITADLKLARVYVTVLGEAEETKAALDGLEHARGFIRRELAHALDLRFVPDLEFRLDEAFYRGVRIDALLGGLKNEQNDQTGEETHR